ncbi:MAG: RDD family protein, partial [Planctomycetota bacterium]
MPAGVLDSLRDGDSAAFDERIQGVDLSLSVQLSSGRVESTWDPETDEVVIANDVLFGRLGLVVAGVPLFLAWFTALLRVGRGRSPGKWLFGLRVVRVDGRPLTWWDAFSRAGGYLGSAGMLGLGFLEA